MIIIISVVCLSSCPTFLNVRKVTIKSSILKRNRRFSLMVPSSIPAAKAAPAFCHTDFLCTPTQGAVCYTAAPSSAPSFLWLCAPFHLLQLGVSTPTPRLLLWPRLQLVSLYRSQGHIHSVSGRGQGSHAGFSKLSSRRLKEIKVPLWWPN